VGNKFDHPFIAKVVDNFMESEYYYIVLELANKGDLKMMINDRINQKKPFNDAEVYKIITNVAIGLSEMHSKGVQHRDLKPANILVH
jgi:serine/threonine protein kinase